MTTQHDERAELIRKLNFAADNNLMLPSAYAEAFRKAAALLAADGQALTQSMKGSGGANAELKALFATTKEEATHNGIEFLMHGKNMAFKIGNQMFTLAHEPDEPGDFEFMKGALLHALSTITPDVNVTFLAKLDQANTKDAIAQAVDRFLGWKLPQDFAPDCGISFAPLGHPNGWPTGTNLFTAVQARQMLEYMLSASPAAPAAAQVAQPLTEEQVTAGAQALCRITAVECGTNADDEWAIYSEVYKGNARAVLAAAHGIGKDQARVGINGLTEAETAASASVMGLTSKNKEQ